MKEFRLYFGKQQKSFLGDDYADIVSFYIQDTDAEEIMNKICNSNWVTINLLKGVIKNINTRNILWFDVVDVKEDTEE